jgi:glucokinase
MHKEAVIGVDLGGTKISLGRVEGGRIVRHVSAAVSAQGPEQQVVDEVIGAVDRIFDSGVAGIGVGVPSVVDIEKGIVYDVQNIRHGKRSRSGDPENRFGRPVYNNDANCFAVGEKHLEKGKNTATSSG